MAAATRKNDCCTGHDACPPVPLEGCSPNVNINGRGAGRVGDAYSPHGYPAHPSRQDRFRQFHRVYQWHSGGACG